MIQRTYAAMSADEIIKHIPEIVNGTKVVAAARLAFSWPLRASG
jgi:hypothetical protein